jgi:hypothetical protein
LFLGKGAAWMTVTVQVCIVCPIFVLIQQIIPLPEPEPSYYQQLIDYSGKNRKLYELIKVNSPSNPETYTDPVQCLQLLFSFFSDALPNDRFDFLEAGFSYMGREKFTEL